MLAQVLQRQVLPFPRKWTDSKATSSFENQELIAVPQCLLR
jgi:hypothetical protein